MSHTQPGPERKAAGYLGDRRKEIDREALRHAPSPNSLAERRTGCAAARRPLRQFAVWDPAVPHQDRWLAASTATPKTKLNKPGEEADFTAAVGGLARHRPGVHGFAVLCVTPPPRGLPFEHSQAFQ